MKKEKNAPLESSEDELNSAELQLLKSSLEDFEDRSVIPPPRKKPENKVAVFAKKNTALTVILAVFAVALIATVVLLCVYLLSGVANGKNKRDYTVFFGEEKTKVKYEDAVINDVLYVDMNKLAKYAELSVSGSENTKKFVASENEYVKFTHDSEYAVINAAKVSIPAPAIVEKGQCLVPYSVVSKIFATGLELSSDTARHKINISRSTYVLDDMLYKEDITFTYEDFTVVAALLDTSGVVFEYNTNVSSYIQYIAPDDSTPYLLLVNKDNPLSADFIPATLSTEPLPSQYTGADELYYLDECASKALVAMMNAMYTDRPKNSAYVTSAYRDYAYQSSLFEQYVKKYTDLGYSREDAEAEVLRTSALPGTSEHQSGLCVDFITVGMKNGLNNTDFEKTSAFKWLSENAYKYGFILRYPENKTSITGYDYESWHFRFVGRDVATAIHFSGICLEEYLEII